MWVCPKNPEHDEFVEIRTRTVSVLVEPDGEKVRDLAQHYEEAVDVPRCFECRVDAETEDE